MRSFLILSILSFLHTGAYSKSNVVGIDTVIISGKKAKVWASSTLQSKQPGRYSVKNVFDGDSTTAWVEGVEGDGRGESISVEFLENVTVKGFLLFPGYTKSVKTLIENVIPDGIKIVVDGKPFSHYYINYSKTDTFSQYSDWYCVPADPINLSPRFIIFDKPIVGKLFELQITGVLPGMKYSDLAISEWNFFLDESKFKPRRTDYEKILSLLSDFAKGNLSDHFASDDIFVENLLLRKHLKSDYLDPDVIKYRVDDRLDSVLDSSWVALVAKQDKNYQDYIISKLKTRGGSLTDPPLQIFLKAEHSDFINDIVMAFSRDNKHYLIGATCFGFEVGVLGSVWVRPIIFLNQKYKITQLGTLKYDRFTTGEIGEQTCGTYSVP
jgi:hypothetical protein